MEPRYSMTGYAIVLFIAGVVSSVMKVSWAPVGAAAFVTLLSGALDLNYLRWRRTANKAATLRSSSRDELDRFARAQWVVGGPVLMAASALVAGAGLTPLHDAADLPKTFGACVTLGAAVLLVSSHVDWFWILPRVSGVVRPGPCESRKRGAEWTYVTETWLFHRYVSEVAGSAAILAIPAYMAFISDGKAEAVYTIATASLGGLVAYREKYLVTTALNIADPAGKVGEIVRVRYESEEGYVWSWAYIVDVSVRGAKAILLDEDGRYSGGRFVRKHDYLLLSNKALRNARRNETAGALCSNGSDCDGDSGGCAGVNWYCHCNPDAHKQSLPQEVGDADEIDDAAGASPRRSSSGLDQSGNSVGDVLPAPADPDS